MLKQLLDKDWKLQAAGGSDQIPPEIKGRVIGAAVPGCVHTDLLAAGLIEDPYLALNELKVQWIGRTDWRYTCRFSVDAELLKHERLELVCEGLDTIARLELNGKTIGETEDMHVPYRFDVKDLLRAEANELAVTFSSALRYAEEMRGRLGDRPCTLAYPFNFIRKMACNFGWDWGPTLVTAGIWRPIYLQAWNTARLKSVRPQVLRAETDGAKVEVLADIERAHSGPLTVTATLTSPDKKTFSGQVKLADNETLARIEIEDISRPEIWWPVGHGQQPLYGLRVELTGNAGNVSEPRALASGSNRSLTVAARKTDEWRGRIGLRTVKLNTTPDEKGSKFVIEVNGKPIFCKGVNWIPDDCFLNRVSEARYRRRLEQARGANMNMLRVWGGGIFESDTFYSLCDELGLMVWQDFLFACAMYPEEPPFDKLIAAEARQHVARLSSHPSLVLWNGCNENIWAYFDWGWKPKLGGRTWGLGYYLELLPRIVKELDPTRPYWPASPYSGSMDIHPLDDNHGNKHIWDAWNSVNYTVYRKYTPRFVSEFGHQAPPTYPALCRAIPADQLRPDSPAMRHHQKADDGNDKLLKRLAEHFNIPENFADWLYLMQLNQARAMMLGVEWFRSRQPLCMGTLYWQLNDCWPVSSWAAVDGDGRCKPLWYATRRFYAGRLLTIQPRGEAHKLGADLELFAINDSDEPWRAPVKVWRTSFAGQKSAKAANLKSALNIAPRSTQIITLPGASFGSPADTSGEFLAAQAGDSQALWFFDIDKNLAYPEPKFKAAVKASGSTYRMKITAQVLLRDLALFAERLDPEAFVNEQLVTLLPGESFTFVFQSRRELSREALTSRPVLQCANYYGSNK